MSNKQKLADVVKAFTKAKKEREHIVSDTAKQVNKSRQTQTGQQPRQG